MLKIPEEYSYSSYNYFLNVDNIPECLQQSWIVQNYGNDTEAIKAFLNSPIDVSQLDEIIQPQAIQATLKKSNSPNIYYSAPHIH